MILDFEYAMRRMNEDKVFSLLYPACEVAGKDTDEVCADVHKAAKLTGETPMMMATIFRQHMLGRVNRQGRDESYVFENNPKYTMSDRPYPPGAHTFK